MYFNLVPVLVLNSVPTLGLFSSQLVKDYANQLIGELKNRIAEMASNLDLFMGIGKVTQKKQYFALMNENYQEFQPYGMNKNGKLMFCSCYQLAQHFSLPSLQQCYKYPTPFPFTQPL